MSKTKKYKVAQMTKQKLRNPGQLAKCFMCGEEAMTIAGSKLEDMTKTLIKVYFL